VEVVEGVGGTDGWRRGSDGKEERGRRRAIRVRRDREAGYGGKEAERALNGRVSGQATLRRSLRRGGGDICDSRRRVETRI
jgi:hypothetical protein